MAVTETFAVALAGSPEGWLVEAASAGEAIGIVHGTVPCAREELLVWTERYYRARYMGLTAPGGEL